MPPPSRCRAWWSRSGCIGLPRPRRRERILPTGTLELIFDLGRRAGAGAFVSGARSTSFVIETDGADVGHGRELRAGVRFPFLAAPAGEFQDALVPLEAVWGPQAVEIRERLAEAPTAAQKFRILEAALLDRATHGSEPHPACPSRTAGLPADAAPPSIGDGGPAGRAQSPAIHPGLPRSGRAGAQGVLPRPAVPAGPRGHRRPAEASIGRPSPWTAAMPTRPISSATSGPSRASTRRPTWRPGARTPTMCPSPIEAG